MSLIYRIGIMAAMFLSFLSGFGQTRSQKIFDTYPKEEGFTYFSFSKSMIDALNLNMDDQGKKVTGDLQEIRILIYNKEKGKMARFGEIVSEQLKGMKYEQVHPKDENPTEDCEFWIEGKGDRVSECHVVIKGKDDNSMSLLVSFFGNFKVEDLKALENISRKHGKS